MKWIDIDFRSFEMDNFCSYIIFMNDKSRILELYGIRWTFDKSAINLDEFNKLNDAIIDQDEQRYNSQFKGKGDVKKGPIASNSALLDGGRPKTSCCSIF